MTTLFTPAQLAERWAAERFPAHTIRRWCAKGVFPGAFGLVTAG